MALRDAGVDLRLGASVAGVTRNGVVSVVLGDGSGIEADEVLAALGRVPSTKDLGLETVGIEPDARGHLVVDESLRVGGRDWLYAVGDVNGRVLLTHMGKYQGRLAADAILGERVAIRSDRGRAPRVIFTEPQIGAVGYTLAAALGDGLGCARSTSRRAVTPGAPSSAAAPSGRPGS